MYFILKIVYRSLNQAADLNHGRGFIPFSVQKYFLCNDQAEFILCGEKIDGKVSIRSSADSEGNKNAEAEVEVNSKGGNISGSVSGSISQDGDGHTEAKVEVEGTWCF